MNTTKIHITPAQADVVQRLIVSTPWFRKKAKKCVFSSGKCYTLEFELESDAGDLLNMLAVATRFGFSYRTCHALEGRIRAAAEHARAIGRKAA